MPLSVKTKAKQNPAVIPWDFLCDNYLNKFSSMGEPYKQKGVLRICVPQLTTAIYSAELWMPTAAFESRWL